MRRWLVLRHLIKDRSEIVGEVENDARKIAKEFLIKFDLVGFCSPSGFFSMMSVR
jgi:hypothetical protein